MISNSAISDIIELTSKLLTLLGKDDNRAKIYGAVSFSISRMTENLGELPLEEILKIRGIGKSLGASIEEIKETGTLTELENLMQEVPEGVLEMFKVKGLGVKKIKALWEELGIDNLNDLKIACESDKIAKTKGFGTKTQVSILESLAFLQEQAGKLRMNKGKELSEEILHKLRSIYSSVEEVGQVVRKTEVVDFLSFMVLIKTPSDKKALSDDFKEDFQLSNPFVWRGNFKDAQVPVEIIYEKEENVFNKRILLNSSQEHLKYLNQDLNTTFYNFLSSKRFNSEEEAYELFGSKYILPEMREGVGEFEWYKENDASTLITWGDLKGSVHNHSTYSDGKHTLLQMSTYCKELGLEYFGIADHSKSAAYAGGLEIDALEKQWKEIDEINQSLAPFKVIKGIESDILSDGSLDYPSDVLSKFDYVVASVHSGLNMDISRATDRLIKAIENPFTTILGHPTGRLLLSRKGYPIDYKKVIDACAANNVVMELNASPYRLDLDWRWIPYCLHKGVKISINPDAHAMEGFHDMQYGIDVARKAGLKKSMTFNAMDLPDILEFLALKK